MERQILTIVVVLFLSISLNAQDHVGHDHSEHEIDNEHEKMSNHAHHRNELGIALAPVYFLNEKETAFGLHVHYIRNLKNSKFGLGFGYERIFDEHEHHTIGIVGSYRPFDNLTLNLAPGVAFEGGNDEEETELKPAVHIEGTYEFLIGDIHIGPVFEIAYDPEDIHISLGIHIGLGF